MKEEHSWGLRGMNWGVAEAPTTDFEQAVDMCIDTVERRKDDQVARSEEASLNGRCCKRL